MLNKVATSEFFPRIYRLSVRDGHTISELTAMTTSVFWKMKPTMPELLGTTTNLPCNFQPRGGVNAGNIRA
jgi:hypothetical protein